MKCQPQRCINKIIGAGGRIDDRRDHVTRQTHLGVTLGAQEVELPALPANENVGSDHVGTAGQIKCYKRDLARPGDRYAAGTFQRFQIRRQRRHGSARICEQTEDRRRGDNCCTRKHALC